MIEKCCSQYLKKKCCMFFAIPANDDYDYDDDECVHPSSKFSLIWNFCINLGPSACTQYNLCNECVMNARFTSGSQKHMLIGENLIFLHQFHSGKFAGFCLVWAQFKIRDNDTTLHWFLICVLSKENRAVLAAEYIA